MIGQIIPLIKVKRVFLCKAPPPAAAFRGDLCVAIVRVNDVGVVEVGGVGGQVFSLKVICSCCRTKVGQDGLVEVLAFCLVY